MSEKQKNVLGEDLEECSNDPLTGWFRDGCCNTDENDHGLHTVCAKVTTECLEWMKEAGNDLITPHPEFGFPGLKDGDGWCLCASWYARAVEAGKGCPIFLKRTHENTLKYVPIEILKKFAIEGPKGLIIVKFSSDIFLNFSWIWLTFINFFGIKFFFLFCKFHFNFSSIFYWSHRY